MYPISPIHHDLVTPSAVILALKITPTSENRISSHANVSPVVYPLPLNLHVWPESRCQPLKQLVSNKLVSSFANENRTETRAIQQIVP